MKEILGEYSLPEPALMKKGVLNKMDVWYLDPGGYNLGNPGFLVLKSLQSFPVCIKLWKVIFFIDLNHLF